MKPRISSDQSLRLLGLGLVLTAAWQAHAQQPTLQPGPFMERTLTQWTVSEFQPDINLGGRVNSIAVRPQNNNLILVASTGGLMRSDDGGANWKRVETLPVFWTHSVAFLPGTPQVVLLTAADDFKAASGGGIWRSIDGGKSWAQVQFPGGIKDRLTAFGLSIAPDSGAVYVACNLGCLVSTDGGAGWSYVDVFPSGGAVLAVAALGSKHVLAGGPGGIRRSDNGGVSWTPTANGPAAISDMHAFGSCAPFAPQTAYVAEDYTHLYYTEDFGDHWTQIPSAPASNDKAGGIAFVKPVPHVYLDGNTPRTGVNLFYGNRLRVYYLWCPPDPLTGKLNYTGKWANMEGYHDDTRDLAFNSLNVPVLLGTDGGLHATNNGGINWTWVGGGQHGYNALQITEINGQTVWGGDLGVHDLYFGTQDNYFWSSFDGGKTWKSNGVEGGFIDGLRKVSPGEARITYCDFGGGRPATTFRTRSFAMRRPGPTLLERTVTAATARRKSSAPGCTSRG